MRYDGTKQLYSIPEHYGRQSLEIIQSTYSVPVQDKVNFKNVLKQNRT